MKYMSWILGLLGLGAGFGAGFYVGKKKEERMYEADIASVKEEYQKKLEETKKRMQEAYGDTKPEDEEQKLTPNGDIDDSEIVVTTYNEAIKHKMEDVVYFAKDNVWYNQDLEKTYDKSSPFAIPSDLFSYFGDDDAKIELAYIRNTKTDEYFCIRYNAGSYVSNVLGYDDSSEGGKEE